MSDKFEQDNYEQDNIIRGEQFTMREPEIEVVDAKEVLAYGNNNQDRQQYNSTYYGNRNEEKRAYSNSGNRSKKKRRSNGGFGGFAKAVSYAVVFGLVASACFQGSNYIGGKLLSSNGAPATTASDVGTTPIISQVGNTSNGSNSVEAVAENAMPSIVAINSSTVTQSYGFFNEPYSQEREGSGSGIIIGKNDKELLILTNNHVIANATKLSVQFIDKEVADAVIKGSDASSDLAVISVDVSKIKSSTLDSIKIAVLNDSDNIKMGQQVVAIGNALGYGQSVTGGYISAKDREVTFEDKTMTLLQTDAAINPGNSGGALLNMSGEVIGINTAKLASSGVEGMGYAIPVSKAISVVKDLMAGATIPEEEKGALGISGRTITEEIRQQFNMPLGVYVAEVMSGSAAEKAGIYQNDIITAIDETKVETIEALQRTLGSKRAGTKVKVTVQRQNQKGEYDEVKLDVTLQAADKAVAR